MMMRRSLRFASMTAATLGFVAVSACGPDPGARPTVVDLGRTEPPSLRALPPGPSSAAAGAGTIPWLADLREARMRAAKSHRPLLILVTADWDVPSRGIEDRMRADSRLVGASRGAIALRVDVTDDEGPNKAVADELRIVGVPTLIVVSPSGREVFRSTGASVDYATLIDALSVP